MRKKLSAIAQTIKTSLAIVIPILFIGSITVLMNGFPIQGYQAFLDSFLGGALRKLIQIIQLTTVGILAVYLTIQKFESLFKAKKMVFVDGADSVFNAALHVVPPFMGCLGKK